MIPVIPGVESVRKWKFKLGGTVVVSGKQIIDFDAYPEYTFITYKLEGNNLPLVGDQNTSDTLGNMFKDFYTRIGLKGFVDLQEEYAYYWGQKMYDFLSSTGIFIDVDFFAENLNKLSMLNGASVIHIKPNLKYRYIDINNYNNYYDETNGWSKEAILTAIYRKEYLPTETSGGFTMMVSTIGIEDKVNNIGFTTEPSYGDLFSKYKSTINPFPEPNLAIHICPKLTKICKHKKQKIYTSASMLSGMVMGVINATRLMLIQDLSFEEGKLQIEKTISNFDPYLSANSMIGIFNKNSGILVVYCGRYNLKENDAVVAFSLSEDKDLQNIIMSASSVPMKNNMNDIVFPTRQDLTYVFDKPTF